VDVGNFISKITQRIQGGLYGEPPVAGGVPSTADVMAAGTKQSASPGEGFINILSELGRVRGTGRVAAQGLANENEERDVDLAGKRKNQEYMDKLISQMGFKQQLEQQEAEAKGDATKFGLAEQEGAPTLQFPSGPLSDTSQAEGTPILSPREKMTLRLPGGGTTEATPRWRQEKESDALSLFKKEAEAKRNPVHGILSPGQVETKDGEIIAENPNAPGSTKTTTTFAERMRIMLSGTPEEKAALKQLSNLGDENGARRPQLIQTKDENGNDIQEFVDPVVGRQFGLSSTTAMRNVEADRARISPKVDWLKSIADRLITEKGLLQRKLGSEEAVYAALGENPAYRTYVDTRGSFSIEIAAIVNKGRPTDIDAQEVAKVIPDPFRDTSESAALKWTYLDLMMNNPRDAEKIISQAQRGLNVQGAKSTFSPAAPVGGGGKIVVGPDGKRYRVKGQ
jgi:hypothetical protein